MKRRNADREFGGRRKGIVDTSDAGQQMSIGVHHGASGARFRTQRRLGSAVAWIALPIAEAASGEVFLGLVCMMGHRHGCKKE